MCHVYNRVYMCHVDNAHATKHGRLSTGETRASTTQAASKGGKPEGQNPQAVPESAPERATKKKSLCPDQQVSSKCRTCGSETTMNVVGFQPYVN